MTVEQLIQELGKYPPQMEVRTYSYPDPDHSPVMLELVTRSRAKGAEEDCTFVNIYS